VLFAALALAAGLDGALGAAMVLGSVSAALAAWIAFDCSRAVGMLLRAQAEAEIRAGTIAGAPHGQAAMLALSAATPNGPRSDGGLVGSAGVSTGEERLAHSSGSSERTAERRR